MQRMLSVAHPLSQGPGTMSLARCPCASPGHHLSLSPRSPQPPSAMWLLLPGLGTDEAAAQSICSSSHKQADDGLFHFCHLSASSSFHSATAAPAGFERAFVHRWKNVPYTVASVSLLEGFWWQSLWFTVQMSGPPVLESERIYGFFWVTSWVLNS